MRPEKEYLIREASEHLEKSTYFFLTDYKGINAEQTTELRSKLAERGAEFHVVKNSSLRLAAKGKDLPDLSNFLSGHTAIIVGGDDASGVAKDLGKYFKKTEKWYIYILHYSKNFYVELNVCAKSNHVYITKSMSCTIGPECCPINFKNCTHIDCATCGTFVFLQQLLNYY